MEIGGKIEYFVILCWCKLMMWILVGVFFLIGKGKLVYSFFVDFTGLYYFQSRRVGLVSEDWFEGLLKRRGVFEEVVEELVFLGIKK